MTKATTSTKGTSKNFTATKTQSEYSVQLHDNQLFIKGVSVRYDKEGKLQNNFYTYKFAKWITLSTLNNFLATTNADYLSKEITDRFLEKGIAKKIVKSEIDDQLANEMTEEA